MQTRKKGKREKREGKDGGVRVEQDALFVEYGDHPRRQWVVRNLRDLQELVAVY
jgi:hypothetical protein